MLLGVLGKLKGTIPAIIGVLPLFLPEELRKFGNRLGTMRYVDYRLGER